MHDKQWYDVMKEIEYLHVLIRSIRQGSIEIERKNVGAKLKIVNNKVMKLLVQQKADQLDRSM